ncbi:polyadenylate-binding protein 1 [Artemisia annua]|uniref:Polyadenylate-binding protein 1 n=1 Tax=Artemisia annua TaxID=35608 RepID=A0A2U1QAA6_ARTAN|nr:polyadenylate-binding protein 1 [Artemisia annua]
MKDGNMVEYAQNSLLSKESEWHRRQLKVAKRTNVPRLNKFRARRPSPYGFPFIWLP